MRPRAVRTTGGDWLRSAWVPIGLCVIAAAVSYVFFDWAPLARSGGGGATPTMKHFVLLIAMTLLGTVGSIYHPFWGLLLYYVLAVLRPQHLWEWSLPVEWRWSLMAACIVAVGVLMNLHTVLRRGRLNHVLWLLLGFGLLLLMSCLTAHDPDVAQQWGMEYAKIIVIAMITGLVIDRAWQVRVMAAMVLVTLGYIAWEINALYLFQGRLDIFHYGYGGLDNNGAGLMLAMGLPFAYAFGVSASKRWMRAVAWAIGLLIIHAILMSYSRGAMLAAFVGICWLLWHHRKRYQSAAIAAVLFVCVSILAGQEIRDRFFSTMNYQTDRSAQNRMESWSAAWQVALEHPLTGLGIRNSNAYAFNYGADRVGRTIHSQYLQIAADSGIPAMVIYIALLSAALWALTRSRWRCLNYLQRRLHDHRDEAGNASVAQAADLALAVQTALIIFAFGGLFLSLEVFELPWLMLVLAGVYPRVIRQTLDAVEGSDEAKAYRADNPPPRRRRKHLLTLGPAGGPVPALKRVEREELAHG